MSAGADWLAGPARATPDHPALEIGGVSVSYAGLQARAASVADWLRGRGIGPGNVVAALLPNGAAFVELLHAAAACGATLLPLNARSTAHELAPQLVLTKTRLLIHDGSSLAATALAAADPSPQTVPAVHPGSLPIAKPPAAREPLPIAKPPTLRESITPGTRAPDTTLAILFTSGTTGPPKGAMLSHENFRSSARASAAHLGVCAADRWLACMPLYHVGGISILLRAALYGNTVVLHERFEPAAVNDALDRAGITCASLVPTILARVLDARGARPAPRGLRTLLIGGGAAPGALLARARALGFPISPTYGLTEASSQVATRLPDAKAGTSLGCLECLPGTEVRVVDATGRPVPDGDPGELWVRGPGVMQGYFGRPAETAAALTDGWLHTGDFGMAASDGTLTILDRRSDLIVSGGENVYPAEVEAVLAEHPAVIEAAVAAVRDDDLGQRPAAWLVFRAGPEPDAGTLRAFCRERLAGYKVPVAYHGVPALPRTPSGKLLRRQLAATRTGA